MRFKCHKVTTLDNDANDFDDRFDGGTESLQDSNHNCYNFKISRGPKQVLFAILGYLLILSVFLAV